MALDNRETLLPLKRIMTLPPLISVHETLVLPHRNHSVIDLDWESASASGESDSLFWQIYAIEEIDNRNT